MDKELLTAAALDEVFRLAGNRKSWLFFCAGVDHAGHVADALQARGVEAATVTGDTPSDERDAILRAFKAGELQAVTNANVLTTGFDAPNIDLLVLLRPTTSPGLYTQILGRGMRLSPTKDNCLVLDFAGNVERFGCIDQIKPPRAATFRGRREAHERTCMICPQCRMASPLGSLECADCGHGFQRQEVVRHDTTASLAEVMSGDAIGTRDLGEWVDVDKVEYHQHEKEGKTPTLRVEYACGLMRYKEWVCLEHPPGFARGKAVDWWKRRYDGTVPDNIGIALFLADALRRPIRVRVQRDDKFWRVTGYDFTGWTIEDKPAPEAGLAPDAGGDTLIPLDD
jgi:DNA repair protein RadD